MTKKLINKEWFLLMLPLLGYIISLFKFMFDMKKCKISYVKMCLYCYIAIIGTFGVPMVGVLVVFKILNLLIGGFPISAELGIIVSIFLFTLIELLLLLFKSSILKKYSNDIQDLI